MSLQTVWHYFLRDSMHAPSLLPEDIVQECLTHMLLKDFLTVGVLTGMLHCLLESLNTPNHSVVVSDLHGTGVLHGPPATSRDIFSVHLDLSRVMRRCLCHYMVTHHLLGPDRFNRWSSPCVLRGVVAPFLCISRVGMVFTKLSSSASCFSKNRIYVAGTSLSRTLPSTSMLAFATQLV